MVWRDCHLVGARKPVGKMRRLHQYLVPKCICEQSVRPHQYNERIEPVWTRKITADDELLYAIHTMLYPGAGPLPGSYKLSLLLPIIPSSFCSRTARSNSAGSASTKSTIFILLSLNDRVFSSLRLSRSGSFVVSRLRRQSRSNT